jgi:protein-disulfide isomerase
MKQLLLTLAAALALSAQASTAAQATVGASQGASPAAANKSEDCGCEGKPLPDVLAVVNGVKITKQDLSPEVEARVAELQRQVVEARKRESDLEINSALLEAEAKRRGVAASKVLEDEVVSKTQEPTDADAQSFYDQNKARIQSEFKDVKADIVSYLREERQRETAAKFFERLRAAAQLKVLNPNVTPPATAADRARVFATVNGRNITSADIEDALRPLVASVQEQVYNLRRQSVDLKINDLLLEQEAQKKGVTARALLETEVASKVPPVTEAQAQEFYNQNKARINGDFAQLKPQIIQYLQDEAQGKASNAFAERLRAAATIQNFLNAPEAPVYQIATDDQPSKGNPAAAVTLVEFTDYQCPSCAATQPAIERLATEYGDRVRFVVRDFPLSIHENAFKAAEAAEAAREQGKYWEYVALLFRNQSALTVPNLKEFATAVGLDRAKFDAALDSGKLADKVRRDLADGQRVGVNATPSLFVNGRRVNDRSYEGLKLIIEDALKNSARK